ncbi:hypothetical protein, partial [Staphylococcus epidermidis]|uniref:hypothetical protein n=1 Tax=Staphylococcus epidermidis TaxID=1282 RepID=UPI001C8EB61A
CLFVYVDVDHHDLHSLRLRQRQMWIRNSSIMAHRVDEFIRKDMYLSYIDVYKDVFKAYLEK